jgi:hypothetical protein
MRAVIAAARSIKRPGHLDSTSAEKPRERSFLQVFVKK